MGDSIPYQLIDQINQRKDNPTTLDMMYQRRFPSRSGFLSPIKYGHRKYNHDPMSNFIIGMQLGGIRGVQAAFLHDIEDMISDDLAAKFGVHGRNIFEAVMNYSFSQHRKHDRHRRSMIKRLY